MLTRIALIIAILGGLGAGAWNLISVREKITTTIHQRDENKTGWDTEAAARKKADKLAKDTQTKLDATNAMLVATSSERDAAVSRAEEKQKLAETLTENLKKVTEDRDVAQNELAAWKGVGVPLEQIKSTLASVRTITAKFEESEMIRKELAQKNTVLQEKIDFILNPEHEVKMQAGLRGKVLVTDPKYDFVVLNIGENQGAKEYGNLIVNRNGKLVAKVQIRSLQADRSIANVVPGWKLSDVMEGDQVLY